MPIPTVSVVRPQNCGINHCTTVVPVGKGFKKICFSCLGKAREQFVPASSIGTIGQLIRDLRAGKTIPGSKTLDQLMDAVVKWVAEGLGENPDLATWNGEIDHHLISCAARAAMAYDNNSSITTNWQYHQLESALLEMTALGDFSMLGTLGK